MARIGIGFVLFLVALGVIAAVFYGVMALIQAFKRRKTAATRRQRDDIQRDIATYAPAVLKGDPLLSIVIRQGKQLETARKLLDDMQGSSETFVHSTHQQRLNALLAELDKES